MNSSLCTVFPRLFTSKVKSIQNVIYIADFYYLEPRGNILYRVKKKLKKVSADKNTQIKYTLQPFSSRKEYSCKIWFRQC